MSYFQQVAKEDERSNYPVNGYDFAYKMKKENKPEGVLTVNAKKLRER